MCTREAEVSHLALPFLAQQYVRRLKVPVYDRVAVQVFDTPHYLSEYDQRFKYVLVIECTCTLATFKPLFVTFFDCEPELPALVITFNSYLIRLILIIYSQCVTDDITLWTTIFAA